MTSHKGPGPAPKLDGSALRIAILHSRWNPTIIEPLVSGTKKALLAAGVHPSNIITESVPGAWELPLAAQRLYAASQIQSASAGAAGGSVSAGDLLGGGSSVTDLTLGAGKDEPKKGPFDAVVAIGCLIKGETMHFEYIAETVSRGLMRVQLDAGVPIVFGVLTVLKEEQARKRAGLDSGENHGESWGQAAVELGVKRTRWARGEVDAS